MGKRLNEIVQLSVEGEVFFQDVVNYTCEEGRTVTGSVGGKQLF